MSIISLILTISLFPFTSFQSPPPLTAELRKGSLSWDDPIFQTFDEAELAALPHGLKLRCGVETNRAYSPSSSRKIDLNQDGLPDWIFSTGCPYAELSFLLRTDTSTQAYRPLRLRKAGKIQGIYQEADQTIIRIRSNGVGCDYGSTLTEWRISKGQFTIQAAQYLFWTDDMVFPENSGTEALGTGEIRQQLILRSGPKVDDKMTVDPCSDQSFRGNQLGTLKTGTTYQVLARQQDDEGQKWEFIQLTTTDHYEHFSDSKQSYQPQQSIVMGWILP